MRTTISSTSGSPRATATSRADARGATTCASATMASPLRLYDTGATPFKANGSNVGLPAAWVPAGSTAGMSALDRKSHARQYRVGSPHRRVARSLLRESQLDGVRRVSAPRA